MNVSVNTVFNTEWYKVIIMIVLELWLTYSAFSLGFACSKVINQYWNILYYKYILYKQPQSQQQCSNVELTNTISENTTNIQNITHNNSEHHTTLTHQLNNNKYSSINSNEENQLNLSQLEALDTLTDSGTVTVIVEQDIENATSTATANTTATIPTADSKNKNKIIKEKKEFKPNVYSIQTTTSTTTIDNNNNNTTTTSSSSNSRYINTIRNQPKNTLDTYVSQIYAFLSYYEYYIWCILFCAIALSLWITFFSINSNSNSSSNYFNNNKRKNRYISIALAPLGSWIRYYISTTTIKSYYTTLYIHTLLCNIIAVLIMCLLLIYASNDTWKYSINAGFCGTLSTVSTFISELHNLNHNNSPLLAFR